VFITQMILSMFRFCTLFLCLAFTISCTTNMDEDSLRTDFLVNCWTHSMEEDPDGTTQVYRTCDSMDFPASRFRMVFDLKADGSCTYLELSPVDAHMMVPGTWSFENGTQRLMIFAEKGDPAFMMTVEKLEEQVVELRSI